MVLCQLVSGPYTEINEIQGLSSSVRRVLCTQTGTNSKIGISVIGSIFERLIFFYVQLMICFSIFMRLAGNTLHVSVLNLTCQKDNQKCL